MRVLRSHPLLLAAVALVSACGSVSARGPDIVIVDDVGGLAIDRLSTDASQLYVVTGEGTLVYRNETNGDLEARTPDGATQTVARAFADIASTSFWATEHRVYVQPDGDDHEGPLFGWAPGEPFRSLVDASVNGLVLASSPDERYLAVTTPKSETNLYGVLVKDVTAEDAPIAAVTSTCLPRVLFLDPQRAVAAVCPAAGTVDLVRIAAASRWAPTPLATTSAVRAPKLRATPDPDRVLLLGQDAAWSLSAVDGTLTSLAGQNRSLRVDASGSRIVVLAADGSLFLRSTDGAPATPLLPAGAASSLLEVTDDFRLAAFTTVTQTRDLEVPRDGDAYVPQANLTDLQLVSLAVPAEVAPIVTGARVSPGTNASSSGLPFGAVLSTDARFALYFVDVRADDTGTLVAHEIATGEERRIGERVSFVTRGGDARLYFEDGYRGPASYLPGFRSNIRSVDLAQRGTPSFVAFGTNTGIVRGAGSLDTFYFSVGLDGAKPGLYRATAK